MAKFKLSVASLAMLMVCGSLYAAEPAGKVLVLQGAAVAVRGAQEIPLERGTSVESGDLIRVGNASSLQIRFTDEAIVALRANTQFKIEDYKFTQKADADKSVFSLLKGGLRTITGLIGKRNPSAYSLKSETATIGIRGTHFIVVRCFGDCRNDDGSLAEDGLYGTVTDGRIFVFNQAGESEFSRDQYFVVGSPHSPARGLIAPPSFLRDKLDGVAKNKSGSQGKTAESQVNSAGGTSTTETTSPAPTVVSTGFGTSTPTASYSPSEAPTIQQDSAAVAASGSMYSFAMLNAWVENWNYSGPNGSGSGVDSVAFGEQVVIDPAVLGGYDYVKAAQISGVASMADYFKMADSYSYDGSYTDSVTGLVTSYTGTHTKSASVENGFSAAAGNVSWGVFSETGSEYRSDGSTNSWSGIQHWALGDPVTAAPTSGIFTYNAIGGTSPTDQNGSVGTVLNRGQWTVNFGNSTLQTTQPIAWSMPGGTSYSVSVPNQAFVVTTYTEPGFASFTKLGSAGGGDLLTYTSCTGCISSSSQVGVTGFGAQAQGLGAAVATNATLSAGVEKHMASVQIYQR